MYFIKSEPSPIGNHGNPMGQAFPGCACLPDGLLGDYLATKGFATLTIEDDMVTDVAVNRDALDAYQTANGVNDLSTAITDKVAEISTACNTTIVNGIDLTLGGEMLHFNMSIEDQQNIANLFRVAELGGTEFPYQSDGGVCRIYTAQEIATIYLTAQTLITTQTTYHNALKSYVQSLEDVEQVRQVQYGMTLPEPYLSEMTAKLGVAQSQMETIMARLNALGAEGGDDEAAG